MADTWHLKSVLEKTFLVVPLYPKNVRLLFTVTSRWTCSQTTDESLDRIYEKSFIPTPKPGNENYFLKLIRVFSTFERTKAININLSECSGSAHR